MIIFIPVKRKVYKFLKVTLIITEKWLHLLELARKYAFALEKKKENEKEHLHVNAAKSCKIKKIFVLLCKYNFLFIVRNLKQRVLF